MHPNARDFRLMFEPRASRIPSWLRTMWLWF
jgi:hypothetical protein